MSHNTCLIFWGLEQYVKGQFMLAAPVLHRQVRPVVNPLEDRSVVGITNYIDIGESQ
jgi:hypothetical protein